MNAHLGFRVSWLLPLLAAFATDAHAASYTANFTGGTPAGSSLLGNATINATGGVGNSASLRLTENTGGQTGSWVVNDFSGGAAVTAFSASFSLQFGPAAGADGFSFNWATDLPGTAFAEEGAGTGLIVVFDTFNNGASEAPAIDVKWNGSVIAHSTVPFDFSAAYSAFVPVTVKLGVGGLVTVTFNGTTVHSGVAIPGFTSLSGAKFGFGARTGGAFERHYVDDVSLTTGTFSGLVDNFFVNQATLTGAGNATQDGAISSIAGGERDVQVAVSSGTVSAGTTLGALAVSGGAGASGTVTVTWDGNDDNATTLANTGLGGLNLTAGGDNAFLLGLNSLTGSPTLTLTVNSGASPSTVTLSGLTASTLPQLVRVPFSSFTGTADFANVGAIQFAATALANTAVGVDYLRIGSTTAPAIEALLTDVVLLDNDLDGKASAGDKLRYAVTLKNNSGGTLNNVVVNVPAIANAGAPENVASSPLARDEGVAGSSVPGNAFHTPFNTTLTVANGDADEDLLNNDYVGAPAATITQFGGGTLGGTVDSNNAGSPASSGGHTLTVNADGSFTYVPASGFTGLFTFDYRLANTAGSDTATVSLAVGTRPGATTDAFSVTGNVRLDTATGGLAAVSANDTGDALVVSGTTSPTSGALSFNNGTGKFTYTPNRGYTGGDSFTYTVGNGFGNVTGTVNLTVANRVWFIDVAAVGGGDGRSHTPYNTIATFNAANTGALPNPQDSDIIVLRDGTYGGGLTLRSAQRVIGDGWSGTFSAAAGFSLATGSDVAAFSGTDPVIAPASGNGVNLVSTHRLYGFTVGNTPSGFGFSGGAIGSLVVAECSKTGTGGAMSITTSAAFGGNVSFDTLASSSSTGANLNLVGVTGTLAVTSGGSGMAGSAASSAAINLSGGSVSITYPGNVTKANAGALLNVAGAHSGTLTFQTGTLSATAGTGLQFDNADGTYNFNGTTTLNGGDAGVDILNGSAGTFTFGTGAAITSPSGTAFNVDSSNASITYSGNITQASSAAMVSIAFHASGAVLFQTGTLSATAGNGLQFSNCDSAGGYSFNGTTTLNGGDAGIDIVNGSSGNFTFGSGATITGPSGTAFLVSTSTGGSFGYGGTITKNNGGRAVDIQAKTGGSVSFTGAISQNNSASTGIFMNGNGGGTIAFSGTITLSTSGNAAFTATGGGTVTATASGSTLTTTTGTAVTVTSTTIGGDGLKFRSISASGAANGIVLNTTGSSGGLTVTGDGGGSNNGSGGTIQNTTGAGVSLNSTTGVSLNYLNITASGDDGISGTSVTGLTMNRCNVTNNGNTLNEDGVDFGGSGLATPNPGLFGTVSVANCAFTGNYYNQFTVRNSSSTVSLTMTGCTLTGRAAENNNNDGLFFEALTTATITANVQSCSFSANKGDHFQAAGVNSGNLNITFKNNTLTGGHSTALGQGITINAATGVAFGGYTGTVRYDIDNNTINGAISNGIIVNLGTSGSSALFEGFIRNNDIGTSGVAYSGSTQANGIALDVHGNGTHTVAVTGNIVHQAFDRGLFVLGNDGNSYVMNLTATGNTLNVVPSDPLGSRESLHVNWGATSANVFGGVDGGTLRMDFGGAGALANTITHGVGASDDFRIRQRFNTRIEFPGYNNGGDPFNTAPVVTYHQGRNTGSAGEPGSASANNSGTVATDGFHATSGGVPQPGSVPQP